MALHIKGNRILTDEEYYNEESNGCFGLFIFLFLILLLLAPGIFLMSLLNSLYAFTQSQLWIGVVILCLIVGVIISLVLGKDNFITKYVVTALLCSGFMFVNYYYNPNNCFYTTIKVLFESHEEDDIKEKVNNAVNDNNSNLAKMVYDAEENEVKIEHEEIEDESEDTTSSATVEVDNNTYFHYFGNGSDVFHHLSGTIVDSENAHPVKLDFTNNGRVVSNVIYTNNEYGGEIQMECKEFNYRNMHFEGIVDGISLIISLECTEDGNFMGKATEGDKEFNLIMISKCSH